MKQLSQRSCVSLLSSVAEALLPQINGFADPGTLRQINTAISAARSALDGPLPNKDLRDLEKEITQLVGFAEFFSQGLFLDPDDAETPLGQLSPDELRAVRDVGDVAARAVRVAAYRDAEHANSECVEGLSWAYSLAEESGDSSLVSKINSLVHAAETESR